MSKQYSEHIQTLLKTVRDEFEKEDMAARERQIIQWKKLEYMWEGFQRLWWSEVAHDWRVFSAESNEGYSDQAAFYDKPINVYRAYLETIIAAMSAEVPTIKCIPDDADDTNDVLTAKGGDKIFQLVFKHNNSPLLWMHALFIYVTQGMIAAYNYPDTDEEYGTVEAKEYEDAEEEVDEYVCPLCKTPLQGPELEKAINEDLQIDDEFQPDSSLDEIEAEENKSHICENCTMQFPAPEIIKRKITVSKFVGITSKAKTRQCIEVYGGLNIKIPNYAQKQKDIPYLRFSKEVHYSFIYAQYPSLVGNKKVMSGMSGNDLYERWGRLSPQYAGEYPEHTPTLNQWWFRPSAFNVLTDESSIKELNKEFPNGVKVVYANDIFAEACPEALDDHWTLTENPLSEYLHFNPLGDVLISVQEITNDLISLILQTIEHGIPQTFADSTVLNFDQYRQQEVAPGAIMPAKSKSGKTLQDGFYTVKTATLSQEVMPFGEKIQELGQFASGALPSLYGGDQSNSSRTAAQYSMSRAQSLQRLQVGWKMLNFWWKGIWGKVIPQYIETMLEDEQLVEAKGTTYINTIIRHSELSGKIGSVELESSEQFPFAFGQRRDVLMQLMQSANPAILEALSDPDNMPLVVEAIGLTDFRLPGEFDRDKQFEEIALLIKQEPIPGEPDILTGMPGMEMPSIMPELDVDNHEIEARICRTWLVSESGRQAKVMNEMGYKNVLLHMKMHIMMLQSLQVEAGEGAEEGKEGSDTEGTESESNPNAGKEKPAMTQKDSQDVIT